MSHRQRPLRLLLAAVTAATAASAGCSGEIPVFERSTVKVSENSRIAAKTLLPDTTKFPALSELLSLAEEIYQKQLTLLRERRVELRGRKRFLGAASFTTFAITTLAVGAAAIAMSNSGDAGNGLQIAGGGALAGLGIGTTLELTSFMQEDPASVDEKIHNLQSAYVSMIDRIRLVLDRATPERAVELELGPIIERFIDEAMRINVRG